MKLPEDLALPSNGEALMCILLGAFHRVSSRSFNFEESATSRKPSMC